jgi:hypothetical protein
LIHGPPEILLATSDAHEQFVQVPRVAQVALPTPQATSVLRTEPRTADVACAPYFRRRRRMGGILSHYYRSAG